MQNRLSRFLLPLLAVASLLLLAPPAHAAQTPEVLGRPTLGVFHANGTDNNSWMGDLTEKDLTKLFNNDLIHGLQMPGVVVGDYLRMEYAVTNYITKIKVARLDDTPYSLQVSEDGTVWTPITRLISTETYDAPSGFGTNETWGVWLNAKFVRLNFLRAGSSEEGLAEIEVKGYPVVEAAEEEVVSNSGIASFHNSDGSAMTSNGGGGNNGNPFRLFDNNFTSMMMFPRAPNNGYVMIDFTKNDGVSALNEYFVTKIKVGSTGDKRFTLQYSADGSTWQNVDGAVSIKYAGTGEFEVAKKAKKVRYIWVDGSMWDYSTEYLAEVQVWGMDPNRMACEHAGLESQTWRVVEGSATCTRQGVDERFCPLCEQRFTKTSDEPPLGHDYVTTLIRPGAFKKFGTGTITCTRCDYELSFPNTPETWTTNGPIDMVSVGGLAMDNLVQFTDLTVTSTDHQEWGPNPVKIIDGGWAKWWVSYWVSAGLNNQHVDFNFGTTIDLTQIQIVVHNTDQTLLFFDVDDDTGEETQLTDFTILRVDTITNAADLAAIGFPSALVTQANDRNSRIPYRFLPGGENGDWAPVHDYGKFGSDVTNALVVVPDSNIPALKTNPDGTHPMHQKKENDQLVFDESGKPVMEPDDNDGNQYQAFIVRFYEQPCKHLRIRHDTTKPTGYQLWSGKSMSIIECHPWGTVRGAGDAHYRKETIMIFR